MRTPDLRSLAPWLAEVRARGASDLLLTAGAPPLVRVDGELTPLSGEVLGPDDVERIVGELLDDEQTAMFARDHEVDFSFSGGDDVARFRANAFRQRGSAALALRCIPFEIPTFDDLGIPDVVRSLVALPHGLVLVTGPTGSGKSTTLAAMLDTINRTRACHIITIEDPIEYLHTHARAAVNQRELGTDTLSFARALRSVLREDPDVLLLGEMRDPETIAAALTIAETGHLVLASLHTNDASQTLDRIIDVFAGDRQAQVRVQLAASLQAVVSQRLLPRIGGGRVAAFEVLVATQAVRNTIREGRTNQLRNQIITGREEGMCTLEASMTRLVAEGAITIDDARLQSMRPQELPQG